MLAYNLALFVHFVGLISAFAGFVIVQRAGSRLRAARDMDEVRTWLPLLNSVGPMFGAGYGLLLLSGLFMAFARWRAALPWLVVAIVSLVTLLVVGGIMVGRSLRAMNAAAADARGSIPGELAQRIANPALWRTISALNGLAMGVVFVMTVKPGWIGSLAAVLVAATIGGAISSALARRNSVPTAVDISRTAES